MNSSWLDGLITGKTGAISNLLRSVPALFFPLQQEMSMSICTEVPVFFPVTSAEIRTLQGVSIVKNMNSNGLSPGSLTLDSLATRPLRPSSRHGDVLISAHFHNILCNLDELSHIETGKFHSLL